MRGRLAAALVMVAALAGCSDDGPDVGPGFAVEGGTVHLYRFKGEAVVQFHPKGGSVVVEVVNPSVDDGDAEVCPVAVGFMEGPRKRLGDCVPVRGGKAALGMGAGTMEHVAIAVVGTVRIEEATVTYQPGDNFLAVDFP